MNNIEFICPEKFKGIIPEPYPSFKKIPDWYLKTKNIDHSKCPFSNLLNKDLNPLKSTNIKTCPAVGDALNVGYVVPAWTNFLVRNVDGQLLLNWEHGFTSEYDYHDRNEFDGMTDEEAPNFDILNKVTSPWMVKTSPGVSCLVTHPFWSREKRFTSVSGIMHTDVVPIQLKWFFELNMELENSLESDVNKNLFPTGHPLMLIIPFVREKFQSKVSYSNEKDIIDLKQRIIYSTHDWFGKSYYNKFRSSLGKLFK